MTATILVVDDEPPLVELVSDYLKREGYRVLAAFDGLDALELVRAEHPDVVILDVIAAGAGRDRGVSSAPGVLRRVCADADGSDRRGR